MNVRRIIAAGIFASAAAACAPGSPTFADAAGEAPLVPIAPPTDTAGFVPPQLPTP
jgi:hypothetical protein